MARSRTGVSSPGEPTRADRARPAPEPSAPARSPARAQGGASLLADDRDEEETVSAVDDHLQPSPEPIPENERPFGRYTLLRRLAYGGMGEIFLARQGGAGSLATVAKLVVIKRILGHMKRDDKHRRMFLDEARLQALLNNPQVVQIHDMGEEGGHVYLAMEHVHGPSWRGLIDRCRKNREFIPIAHVCAMVAQAARGLAYAHNLVDVTGAPLRIVHRDINPHNILVSYDGEVKIIDFGIAKSDLADGHTETGTIKGKFSYMSPEQSAASPLDNRSDIFTLGICLYELLTLENPFRKGNVVLSLEAIQKELPAPLGKKRRDAALLQTIVDRCLAKDRKDRFDDAGDLAVALEALLANGVVPAAPSGLGSWLRERFPQEIAEHRHILEETGSTNAVVTRGTDPSSLPRQRPIPSHLSGEAVGPNDPTDNRIDLAPPSPEFTMEAPEPLEQTSQTPAESYDVSSMSMVVERRTRLPAIAAGVFLVVVLGVAAGIGVAFALLPKQAHAMLDAVLARVERKPVEVAVVVPPVVEVKPPIPVEPPPPPPPPVDAPKADPPKEEPPKADPPRDVEPVKPDVKTVKKHVAEPATSPARQQVATVAVTSEGYAVKGSRKIFAGEASTLVIDKDDGAPFTVRLKVRADSFDVDTDPWAIVRVDGIGKGKTPQRTVSLPADRAVSVELVNPTAGKMSVSLKVTR